MKTNAILILSLSLGTAARAAAGEASAGAAEQSVVVTPAYINQLAELMRTNNPGLRSAKARARAANANAQAVRTWEDPKVYLGGMAADAEMSSQEGNLIYGVEQKLPLFGKPQLARKIAQAEAATEQASADYQFQRLRSDLARALFKTALADRVVEIDQTDRAWLETMVATVEAKYRAGQAVLTELLQVQNELSRRTNQVATDAQLLESERAGLNRFLNRDLLTPWPRLELPPVAGPVIYNQRLADLALQYEPRAVVMRQQVKQAEATVGLTRKQKLPEVGIGLEGRNYTGNGEFRQGVFLLSLSVPLANVGKYRKDIERDEEKMRAAKFDLADQELAVREEIHHLAVKIDAARREALLYRDVLIPRSEQAVASAVAAWESGTRTFREVIEARRMLLEGRLMFAKAVAEQYEMMSDLVLCCGLGDFEALEMIGVTTATGSSAPKQP